MRKWKVNGWQLNYEEGQTRVTISFSTDRDHTDVTVPLDEAETAQERLEEELFNNDARQAVEGVESIASFGDMQFSRDEGWRLNASLEAAVAAWRHMKKGKRRDFVVKANWLEDGF